MKQQISVLVLGALALTAASAASAGVSIGIGINPYGYGAYAPPVVYQPDPYYAANPLIYFGGGSWGGGHERHARGRADHGHPRQGGDHGH